MPMSKPEKTVASKTHREDMSKKAREKPYSKSNPVKNKSIFYLIIVVCFTVSDR